MNKRCFLFLQGVATPFFDRLASSIRASGLDTCRVVFCGGDAQYHSSGESICYRGSIEDLPSFYEDLFKRLGVTDLVLFGDTRPVHIPAIELAANLENVETHVYEEGYLRPDWITLDSGGANANSALLPTSPIYYRNSAQEVPRGVQSKKTGYSQSVRLLQDVYYNSGRVFDERNYPHYSRHRLHSPIQEYLGWVRRAPIKPLLSQYAKFVTKRLLKRNIPFYVYPLQLDSDSQIRVHSPYSKGLSKATDDIIKSFANHAPKKSVLIIKNHPLDTGINKHKQYVKKVSKDYDVSNRVLFFDGGHLPTMLHNTAGTVLINSTVGMSSLFHKSPTIALGTAIYDIPGLTFQGRLDCFWRSNKIPNKKLFKDFRDVVIDHTQINGSFYSKRGIEMAIAGSLKRFGIPPEPETEQEPPSFSEQPIEAT
ncbi:capsule biosynthesis protein [Leucothrix arctica]|uniref:Capsular biosynthesis protein n=1 Tax=Leucothrix arctica TaxID=1481894 RepID=A0A317C8K7_9GAMM|nr:capsular biosynthesis protein [Leucothrix arctica]PWQ95005.1 capsular biosynthesis protein [Leucothrix arctica]